MPFMMDALPILMFFQIHFFLDIIRPVWQNIHRPSPEYRKSKGFKTDAQKGDFCQYLQDASR